MRGSHTNWKFHKNSERVTQEKRGEYNGRPKKSVQKFFVAENFWGFDNRNNTGEVTSFNRQQTILGTKGRKTPTPTHKRTTTTNKVSRAEQNKHPEKNTGSLKRGTRDT